MAPRELRLVASANPLFPRSAIPTDPGPRVRREREARRWSQERLAKTIGVDCRTIMRLEKGRHRPTFRLVHALERVLEPDRLVPGWPEPASPDAPSYGARSRWGRFEAGVRIVDAARAADVSPATLSRFEREEGRSPRLVGGFETAG